MRRSKGQRSRTRQLFKKSPREKGIRPLGRLLKEYQQGEKVLIYIESSIHKGQPHRRYHGKIGVIREKRGRAYVVEVQEGGKTRQIIALPEHIKTISPSIGE
jgi:large subunit ribosomal protein L21e